MAERILFGRMYRSPCGWRAGRRWLWSDFFQDIAYVLVQYLVPCRAGHQMIVRTVKRRWPWKSGKYVRSASSGAHPGGRLLEPRRQRAVVLGDRFAQALRHFSPGLFGAQVED